MNPPLRPSRLKLGDLLFLGLNSHVVALNKKTGTEVWRASLKGGMSSGYTFVTLLVDGEMIYAHTKGEVFGIEAISGRVLWNNGLKGFGYGLASLAVKDGFSVPAAVEEQQRSDAQSAQAHSQTTGI